MGTSLVRSLTIVLKYLVQDSVGNFYDCRLTLAPAVDPVASPEGYIFSREAILENLLEQKKANKRALRLWEEQKREQEAKDAARQAVETEAALLAFERRNNAGASDDLITKIKTAVEDEANEYLNEKRLESGIMNIATNEHRAKDVQSFWVPSKAPEAADTLQRPSKDTICPASGKKLRMKDLISVKFTRVPGGEPHEYMDPVTRDRFTNASRLLLLKPTGDVVSEETWEKCIRPDGHYNGVPLHEKKDVLVLKSGGTGFAQHDQSAVESKKYQMVGPAGNITRGQVQGPGSRFGLNIRN